MGKIQAKLIFGLVPLISDLGRFLRAFTLKSFVREVFALPAIKDLILEGPGQRQIYQSHPSVFRGCPKFRMLALRVDFG